MAEKKMPTILTEPLVLKFGSFIARDMAKAEGENAVAVLERLFALLKHYNIEPDAAVGDGAGTEAAEAWRRLAMGLARDHIAGFRPPPKSTRGRPPEWSAEDDLRLVLDVREVMAETQSTPARGLENACRQLARRPQYQTRGWAGDEEMRAGTLRSRYNALIAENAPWTLAKIAAAALEEDPTTATEWRAFLNDQTGNNSRE